MSDNEARTPNDVEREALNAEAIAESEKELPPLIVNGIDTMAVGRIAYVAGYIAGALRRSKEPEWEYRAAACEPDTGDIYDSTGAEATAAVALRVAERYGLVESNSDLPKLVLTVQRRRRAGPWVPVEQEGAKTR